MTRLWQFAGYQRAYRVVTAVWGVGYLVEAGVRVAIVLLCLAPIVLVTLAVLNLHSAATHAKLANTSLTGVFTLWLNSLGVDPAVFNLFENLRDGLVLLQAFDKVYPSVVVWRRVSKPKGGPTSPIQPTFNENGEEEEVDIGVTPNQSTLSRFKQVENTNYCIELGKQTGMSLVGIQGADIVDRNKKLVLGYVWQLMRCALSHAFMISDQVNPRTG